MLKKIKLQNSTILLIGIIIVFIGVCFGFYEYFIERKNKTFSDMNIMLYEREQPQNIINESQIEEIESNNEEVNQSSDIDKTNSQDAPLVETNYLGILEIPKINLKRGFYDLTSKYNNVDDNITVINGSTFPDQSNNNLILAAHSGDCNYCFFDKLYKLKINDIANIQYKNNKYQYKIVNIYEVKKDGTVVIHRNYDKSCLTLITCTRNSNTKQTVYIFEQIN